jgi:LemA protein
MNTMLFVLVVGSVLAWFLWTWNRLIALRAAVQAAWASIDALLKRRTDLIPNLVSVVEGAMDYERGTLERVVLARNASMQATKPEEQTEAEEQLASTVHQLFAVVERYPDLKTNSQILDLQRELSSTEDDIAMARRYYNAVVRDYNVMRESFPHKLLVNNRNFPPAEFFDLSSDAERMVPKVVLGEEQ